MGTPHRDAAVPRYPSGHALLSSAMAETLARLFGDDPGVPIVAASPSNAALLRTWMTFSEGVDEVVEARIYSGIHFRTADEQGARIGRKLAKLVVRRALRETHGVCRR